MLALNQKNAAATLGISVPHFVKHVRPDLRPVYIGGAQRYRVTELQEWLDRNAVDLTP
jgi:predicted DNA-binding transcriptional regulator AlpA